VIANSVIQGYVTNHRADGARRDEREQDERRRREERENEAQARREARAHELDQARLQAQVAAEERRQSAALELKAQQRDAARDFQSQAHRILVTLQRASVKHRDISNIVGAQEWARLGEALGTVQALLPLNASEEAKTAKDQIRDASQMPDGAERASQLVQAEAQLEEFADWARRESTT